MLRLNGLNYKNNSLRSTSTGKRSLNRIYNTILIYQKCCWMCINIDIVLHHATIKRYFDSFLTCRATLGCVGQKCVRPPIFFTGTPMIAFGTWKRVSPNGAGTYLKEQCHISHIFYFLIFLLFYEFLLDSV